MWGFCALPAPCLTSTLFQHRGRAAIAKIALFATLAWVSVDEAIACGCSPLYHRDTHTPFSSAETHDYLLAHGDKLAKVCVIRVGKIKIIGAAAVDFSASIKVFDDVTHKTTSKTLVLDVAGCGDESLPMVSYLKAAQQRQTPVSVFFKELGRHKHLQASSCLQPDLLAQYDDLLGKSTTKNLKESPSLCSR